MSTPITQDELRETLREELNDRFTHFEKRQDVAHEKMMLEMGQIVENVNSHFTSEIGQLKSDMGQRFETVDKRFDGMDKRFDGMDLRFDDMDQRFDTLDKKVDNKNKEIVDTVTTLAKRTGNADLVAI